MTSDTVTREARFDPDAVARLLSVAEAAGSPVDLVKDDGAYLMTWAADGTPVAEVIVYADGHRPAPRPATPTGGPEDPEVLARVATDQVWGGDDFGVTYSPAELRAALEPDGLWVRSIVTVQPFPDNYPATPWGRRDPIHTLVRVELARGGGPG